LDPYGDCCASAILARAQRREVRPNIWASFRSDNGFRPAEVAPPVEQPAHREPGVSGLVGAARLPSEQVRQVDQRLDVTSCGLPPEIRSPGCSSSA
jgi:hypothetical protein